MHTIHHKYKHNTNIILVLSIFFNDFPMFESIFVILNYSLLIVIGTIESFWVCIHCFWEAVLSDSLPSLVVGERVCSNFQNFDDEKNSLKLELYIENFEALTASWVQMTNVCFGADDCLTYATYFLDMIQLACLSHF